jgi:hypothetical protein
VRVAVTNTVTHTHSSASTQSSCQNCTTLSSSSSSGRCRALHHLQQGLCLHKGPTMLMHMQHLSSSRPSSSHLHPCLPHTLLLAVVVPVALAAVAVPVPATLLLLMVVVMHLAG